MPTIGSFVPLMAVVISLGGAWFVTARVTDHWDRTKKHREMDLAAAVEFQKLYGDLISVWKTWNAIVGNHTAPFASDGSRWDCLVRATAAEGGMEALIAKLASERQLTDDDIEILGAVRQAFKTVRRTIRRDEPLNWWSSSVAPYSALKSLSAATSVLIATPTRTRHRPSVDVAVRNFLAMTDNRHESRWKEELRSS